MTTFGTKYLTQDLLLFTCDDCGAFVDDRIQHSRWHAQLVGKAPEQH